MKPGETSSPSRPLFQGIDVPDHRLDLRVPAEELARRRSRWREAAPSVTTGILATFAALAAGAEEGAGISPRRPGAPG